MNNNLRSIVNRHKDVIAELENEVRNIENSDLSKENEQLKAELEQLREAHLKSAQTAESLSAQNASLKSALYEQFYNEKLKAVNASKEKLDIYFRENSNNEINKLAALENSIKYRISSMTSILQRNNVAYSDDIYRKLDELSAQVNYRITEAQAQFAKSQGAFSETERSAFEELKNEQITDAKMLELAKKNNVERFVGLNILNSIGILLIIIGVITAARYTYVQLPDVMKSVLMFALGGVMLGAGELMNRKKPNIFSLGITAGGVGVFYAALATSYFGLKIMGMYPALALCILITAGTFFLSMRYNSQTILTFALVGGYLPLFSIGGGKTIIYGAMLYFVLLNLLALMTSFKKKWSVSAFVGLALNIIGTIYICLNFNGDSALADKIILTAYILFAFLNYTLIPIVSTYTSKLKFRKHDTILLAINTFFSSLIIYATFYSFGWDKLTGLLSAVFALTYLSLWRLIKRKFGGEKTTEALFGLTGLVFTILIVPFQFDKAWLTLGWLAEGVALATYGILKDKKDFKRAGFAIKALCLWAFMFFDVLLRTDYLFAYKYLAMTLGSLIILGAFMRKKTLADNFQKPYKCAVIVNLWFYTVYICNKLHEFVGAGAEYNTAYLTAALAIALTFAIAYTAPRIRMLSDKSTKIISAILYAIGGLWLFGLNTIASPYCESAGLPAIIIGSAVLVIISLLSVLAMRDFIKFIVMERKLGVEWYPLIVSAYFVIILTQNLITQYHLSFTSAWISIIYVLTALLWILFGFVRRYSFIRKSGLGLALLAVAKLFLVDLRSLTQGYQIISYFALGITLVAISFVYQYFNKRLELKIGSEEVGE